MKAWYIVKVWGVSVVDGTKSVVDLGEMNTSQVVSLLNYIGLTEIKGKHVLSRNDHKYYFAEQYLHKFEQAYHFRMGEFKAGCYVGLLRKI